MGPAVKGNPLKISVLFLVFSYVLGEFFMPSYPLLNLINLIIVLNLILFLTIVNVKLLTT